MEARCPKCGGKMTVTIEPTRRDKLVEAIIPWLLVLGILCIVWFAEKADKPLNLIAPIFFGAIVLLPVLFWLFDRWKTAEAIFDDAKRHRKHQKELARHEREKAAIEEMLQKDPNRVRMECERCGSIPWFYLFIDQAADSS
ncbi:MAG: hypothetical protein ACE5NG_07265 [bacterium]